MSDAAGTADEPYSAFPASENTPGQAESRQARARFLALKETCPWFEEFLELRAEGWDWRKAAYIAWAASPAKGRWPKNQQELAVTVLGLKSDRTIRTWKEKNPEMERRVATLQVEPLARHLRDFYDAVVDNMLLDGKNGAADRRLFAQLMKLIGGKNDSGSLNQGAPAGTGAGVENGAFAKMDDEELEQSILNMQAAVGMEEGGDDDPDGE